MTFDPHRRIHSEEILDTGTAPDDDLRQSLLDLRRINAYLGGRRVLLALLAEQLRRTGLRRFTMLDVGTGSGDLLAAVAGWSRTRAYGQLLVGLDRQIRHLCFLAPDNWTPVCADVRAIPFPPHSFDFVSASLFLHHFEDHAAVEVLRCLSQIARHALLVNDLERHAFSYHFIRLAPFFARSPVTRFDGPASVQRAFRKEELEELARSAGLAHPRVRKHLPFRLSLVAELS